MTAPTACHRHTLVVLVSIFVVLHAGAAHGQLLVVDPVNIAEASKLVEKAVIEAGKIELQNEAISLLSQKLANMGRYKTTPVPYAQHDVSRFLYGAPWLQALNAGDPTGRLYSQVTRQIVDSSGALDGLPPASRSAIENELATINITDAVAMGGASTAGLLRTFGSTIMATVLSKLETDTTTDDGAFHQMTTILDKVAAGALLGNRQNTAANQMMSGALEQLLAQSKRRRDTEVETMNMRIESMQLGRTSSQSYIAGSADALRTWRQP